jgi:cytochrome c
MKALHCIVAGGLGLISQMVMAAGVSGIVVDGNGAAVPDVQLVMTRSAPAAGARAITVFSGRDGRFDFPGDYPEITGSTVDVKARTLGFRQANLVAKRSGNAVSLTLVLAKEENQVDVAPASAWLARITDRAQQSKFIMDCIDCHQIPGPEVRNYAALIHDSRSADPHVARAESWKSIVKYMNYLSGWEFSRGRRGESEKLNADAVYGVSNGEDTAALLARLFDDRLDRITGFSWGAPSIATPRTAIWEYEVDHPNAVREALLLGNPHSLWVADVAANRMVEVDVASGAQRSHEVPSGVLMSPHSLHRGQDGALWVTPLFNSVVAKRDMKTGQWTTWRLKTSDGKDPGIHDLSFGHQHELLTDARGRIWYSDIGNTAVGYFDPANGAARIWAAPQPRGREGAAALYGLIMTKDRRQVWYSQLGNGVFGGFDIEKQQFIGPFELPDRNAGPRRITISDDDVIYMALYGAGQLAEFDTRTRRMIGVYDLPDTGSAPYSATWDPVRRVVWVLTANGDVIYRFNPRDKSFGVLPMPRAQAFLRMLDIDPATGVLVTSYANIVDIVQGPRMALVIDPGDGAYPQRFSPGTSAASPAPALLARPAASPAGASGATLVENARCYICHDATKASLGPPWTAVAARHAPRREVMVDVLAEKIVRGGGGNWGLVPMVPNQWVTPEEARRMAEWIFDQAAAR